MPVVGSGGGLGFCFLVCFLVSFFLSLFFFFVFFVLVLVLFCGLKFIFSYN